MRLYNPFGSLLGLALTAGVAAIAWFTVGQGILDKVNESNVRSGGGGPLNERLVAARRFGPAVAELRRAAGSEARLVGLTLRPDSIEMTAALGGRARGYRWQDRRKGIQTFEVGGAGAAGAVESEPFSMSKLDPRAPERITRAIASAEGGDFLLSIADLERASSGKVVWIMRGRIGERGIAYYAGSDGRHIKPYDPSNADLSSATQLSQCIAKAHGDPAELQRCVARFKP